MSLNITVDGLTVTATLDTSSGGSPLEPIGVYINWGDDSEFIEFPLWQIDGTTPFQAGNCTGGSGCNQGQWTTDTRFTNDPRTNASLFYLWHGTMTNTSGTTYTATHTYLSAGDFDIYAAWLDGGEQDGDDDSSYSHNHIGYYAGQPTTIATPAESHTIVVKGMDASHNVLATDTYVIESTATPSLPALVIPENWVTVTRQWSGHGFDSSRKCHATLTWSAITGASGYRIRLEERQSGYATGVHPQNTWEYNPTEYEFTTTGTTFEKDFFVAIDGVWQNSYNYIVTALGTTGESSDSEFPELINGSRTSFGQAPGGGFLNIHEPDDDDDDD